MWKRGEINTLKKIQRTLLNVFWKNDELVIEDSKKRIIISNSNILISDREKPEILKIV